MSTYTIPELLRLWRKGDLTAEQAVGHILQNLAPLVERIEALETPPTRPQDPPPPPAPQRKPRP